MSMYVYGMSVREQSKVPVPVCLPTLKWSISLAWNFTKSVDPASHHWYSL